ncbi:MAG: hypothetical protein JNK19_09160 [Tabrizicola sp.]|nr:hypothetical protein [Tabrizicola sp.]
MQFRIGNYALQFAMLFGSAFLILLPLQSSMRILQWMATDGCGQMLNKETHQAFFWLTMLLSLALLIAVGLEFVFPRARRSAWGIVAPPVAAYLLGVWAVSRLNVDFLTSCDSFFALDIAVGLNLIGALIALWISWRRFRQGRSVS